MGVTIVTFSTTQAAGRGSLASSSAIETGPRSQSESGKIEPRFQFAAGSKRARSCAVAAVSGGAWQRSGMSRDDGTVADSPNGLERSSGTLRRSGAAAGAGVATGGSAAPPSSMSVFKPHPKASCFFFGFSSDAFSWADADVRGVADADVRGVSRRRCHPIRLDVWPPSLRRRGVRDSQPSAHN